MADDFGWEREWPDWPELRVFEVDPLGTETVVCYECPRCGGLVRAPARGKHEVVCWGPEQVNHCLTDGMTQRYTEMVRALLRSAPELGEHEVKHATVCTDGKHVVRTTFYGKDFLITIERAVQGG